MEKSSVPNIILFPHDRILSTRYIHDDVMIWKGFQHYWPFVRGFDVDSPHKGPVTFAFMLV